MKKYLKDQSGSEKSLKKAYRKYALLYHPNKSKNVNGEEVFKALSNEYERLLKNFRESK